MKRFYSLLIAFIVAISASMAAHTQLFLVGGFSGWGFPPENELSTTDGDYYVATYPTGSEIELSGDFKLADPTWNILNYGGGFSVEADKSYTLVKGAGNLNAVGKIKITKIEFTVSTATLKIIGATSANLFDLSKDQGVSLVESSTNGEKFVSKLTFKGNGVYTGTYTVPDYEFYLKIGGDGNFNTIDFGFNGNYIVLGEPYLLKKGEMLFAAVYPEVGDWKIGDVFDVQVTFTEDWTATLLLTKSTVTPTPDPVVTITDLKVNPFSQIEAGKTTTTTATYTITNATNATATISGTHAAFFKIISQSVNGTNGGVQIQFAPTTEGKYNAKLTITSGTATASVAISGIALAPKEEVTITNLQMGKFSNTEVGETSTATATYTLSGATSATASLSGADAAYFKILSQNVSNGNGTVVVEFTPTDESKYNATLNITAGDVSESVNFSAMGILPQLPAEINDLKVSSFAITNLGLSTTSTATYKLVNATSATATISGTDAKYFKILSQNVSNGNGTVQIEFTPTQARKYNATLTISSGSASESVAFYAIGQEPVIIISNLQTPKFTVTEEDKTSVTWISYDLEGATSATATLSGADAIYFKIVSQSVSGGRGTVEIEFAPNIARKYNATLTITAGKESESVSFNAIAADAPVAPAIKNLKVEEFDIVRPNESSTSNITYQLENASLKNISVSGTDADYFTLKNSGSDYYIVFTPVAAGVYVATLTITATNGLSASLDFAAACESETHSPVLDPVVSISNLKVPAFEDTQVGKTSFITATFKVKGTTCATASLSGTNATSFKIMSQSVTDGNGEVKIKFVPSKEGVYNATLTVSAGNENVITNITAKTTTAQPDPEPGPGDDPSDDPDPEPGPGDDPSDDPDPEPGPGDDPTPDPEPDPEPDPSPYAEYPLIGYFYWVNTGIEYEPDLEWVKTDNSYQSNLEEIESYQPVWNSRIDVDLVPEKLEQKIYGLDIYKFEVRDKEKIPYVRGGFSKSFEFEDVDITKTPYYANGVWYESIEEMMTWYVKYTNEYDGGAVVKMEEQAPGEFVATLSPTEETDEDDYYYYCLGNVEDPIIVVGIGEYAWNIQNTIKIPQGFKVNVYLEDANWNTYYKLVPPGDGWDKDYVDLGLPSGLCWAIRNVGADEPQDEGEHFAWGEVEPKEDYSYKTYKWANQLKNNEYIKYVTDGSWGTFVDFRNTLEPDDDVANAAWGGKWHMPTKFDVEELLRECTTEFGFCYGVKGYFITGPNGNAIFLPGAEEWEDTDFDERGNGGSYWTSTLNEESQSRAYILQFSLNYIKLHDYISRIRGLVIRPVIHKDFVAIDEVPAIDVYAKEGTIYSELDFEIYNLTGINVTHLNGSLEGIYIVKTNEGNRLISVW
ncbi:MAG: hypothetical protein IKA83_06935 [Paludibacteraceae bacterium]|nr:hypothetical protein [Paludibacteraceae bacterium]